MEALVVEIYRQKSVTLAQREEFLALRERLSTGSNALEEELGFFWPNAKIEGEPVRYDPFLALIGKGAA
ncbi:MAG: hypothetical protein WEA61_10525 [Anaerolineales bacterium]